MPYASPLPALVLLVLVTWEVGARPCTTDDYWPLCQRYNLCAFVFRHDQAAGVRRAVEYYQGRGWLIPQLPNVWQPLSGPPECNFSSVDAFVSTAQPLPPSLYAALTALIMFTHYAEGTAGCPPPQIPQCDDETGQCECFCPSATGVLSPASDDNTFCVTTDSCQNSMSYWALGLGIAAIVLVLAAIVTAIVLTRASIDAVLSKRLQQDMDESS